MLRSLIDILDRAYQPGRHRDLLVALWEQERWFDTHHQRVAAEIERDSLTKAGLSGVRLATYSCDGETRYQDWITHLAWDGPSARLAADDGTVLADRSECPASVVYWSGPLASEAAPAVGEVVDGDALAAIAPEAVDGKFVLTAKAPLEMKHRQARHRGYDREQPVAVPQNRRDRLPKDKGDGIMLRRAAVATAIAVTFGLSVPAGVLSIPESYTPEKSWPVIVSLQDNPDPALTAKSPYFLVHAGGTGVECSSKIHNSLKDLAARYHIDANRIYGTGFSRGGHELLEQTWHYPHLFAAIAPVCNDLRSEPKVFYVKYIQNTPTLLLHGDHDAFFRTGQRVHELMKAANCPVEWGTYPGGHTPEAPFKRDLSLLTKFFEKHAFDPYPKEVTHVVVHPRYARAFWVDSRLVGSFLDRPGTAPQELRPPGGAAGAVQKPYVLREAVFAVRIKDGNRIEIQANEHVAALDLYLTGKLVDLSKPVTVLLDGKTLYEGAPACPLKVKVREGEELKATHLRPLWEDLADIQKQAQYKPVAPK